MYKVVSCLFLGKYIVDSNHPNLMCEITLFQGNKEECEHYIFKSQQLFNSNI